MNDLIPVSQPPYSENRSELRYCLRLPVQMTAENAVAGALTALSENISAHGILLRAEAPIPEKTRLNMAIVAKSVFASKGVQLMAIGKVLRVERCPTNGFVMAVWCSRPFRMTHPDPTDD